MLQFGLLSVKGLANFESCDQPAPIVEIEEFPNKCDENDQPSSFRLCLRSCRAGSLTEWFLFRHNAAELTPRNPWNTVSLIESPAELRNALLPERKSQVIETFYSRHLQHSIYSISCGAAVNQVQHDVDFTTVDNLTR